MNKALGLPFTQHSHTRPVLSTSQVKQVGVRFTYVNG